MGLAPNEIEIRRILNKPINYLMIYLFGLLVLYKWGPMTWNTQNSILLYTYLIMSNLLIFLGYKSTINKIVKFNGNEKASNYYILDEKFVLKIIPFVVIIKLIISFLFLIRVIGSTAISLDYIMTSFINGLVDAGSQYNSKFANENAFGGNVLAPIYTLLSPITWPVIPLTIIYFKKLSMVNKLLASLIIVLEIVTWVSIGTNKGIIDLIIIVATVTMLRRWQYKVTHFQEKTIPKKKRVRVILLISIVLIMGLYLFSNNISSRINSNFETLSNITNGTGVSYDTPIMKITPDNIKPLMVYVSVYLTQGYYGLSLTLDEPFVPMFGLGNSNFLLVNLEQIFNVNLSQYSYQSRIAHKGWHSELNWHSIHTWLANDISFFGVLFLMFFIGKYFANVFYRSLVLRDPVASILLCLIVSSFFYFSANNQILSTPSTFMTFWVMNFLWFIKRLNKNNFSNK
ncbi:hypothetical protein [Paenibacillus sp. 1P07SE]|uniref:hypothetical protein n=1 Tax=Paenibacillus sp. 1P07SE TaxID=3132209 RepID=UPI0039A5F270